MQYPYSQRLEKRGFFGKRWQAKTADAVENNIGKTNQRRIR